MRLISTSFTIVYFWSLIVIFSRQIRYFISLKYHCFENQFNQNNEKCTMLKSIKPVVNVFIIKVIKIKK